MNACPGVGIAKVGFPQLVELLLNCADDQVTWLIANHKELISLDFLQYLKETQVTSSSVLQDSIKTDRITRSALVVAATMSEQPVAMALAQWMRGLWAMHNHVTDAVILFQAALAVYQAIDDRLSVAKLATNLVGVLADVGENQQAEQYYHTARKIFLAYVDESPQFLLALEQNFGYLLYYWGRYEEALAAHNRALAVATQYKVSSAIAEIRVNRNQTLRRLGRFIEMEAEFLQARLLAESEKQAVTVARIDMNLGELYTILGQPLAALRCFRRAAQALVPMEQGPVLATEATLLRHLGAFRAAMLQYKAALSLLEQYGLKTFRAETLVNQAVCLRQFGDKKQLGQAQRLLQQAEQLWQDLGNGYWLAQIYLERIRLALTKNELSAAMTLLIAPPLLQDNPRQLAEYRFLRAEVHSLVVETQRHQPSLFNEQSIVEDYEASIAFAATQGLYWLRRDALHGLGKLLLNTNWPRARQLLENAAETDAQMRQLLSIQELKASFHRQANELYDSLIQGAFVHGEYEQMLQYVWQAKAGAFLDLALNKRKECLYSTADQQRIDQLRQQIIALRWSLTQTDEQKVADEQREAASPQLARLIEQLLQAKRDSRLYDTPISHRSVDTVQQCLAKLDADFLFEYARCGNMVYGICSSKAGVCIVKPLLDVDTITEIAGQLERCFTSFHYLPTTEQQRVVHSRMMESRAYLTQCYNTLVAPLLAGIASSQKGQKFLIAPCDVLATLPFAAFWIGEQYWIEANEIEIIQSGALLLLESPNAVDYSPSLVIAASTGAAVGVQREACAVSAIMPNSVALIDTPVLAHLHAMQNPPRILHIAAHTIQRGDAPLFTGIQLHNEVLSVEQSFDLPLWGTELVTLSGCATASGMDSDAALFAFQSALLIAGSKRILCTLWPIADGIPGPLMNYFYHALQQGMNIPAALRATQLHFLQDPTYCHPALWAAFTTFRR